VSGQASAAIDVAFVNMVLHRLWRSGYFDRELGQAVAGFANGFDGAELDLQLPVAPAIEGVAGDGSISLHLGPLVGVIVAPQFGPDPFTFKASVRVNASAQLDADNGISFGPIVIDELMLAIDGASFGSAQRAELDRVLSGILQEAVNTILERNVPTLPIPVFTTPEAFSAFGVEEGTMVGVRQANLSSTVRTLFASGRFGELPTADAEDGDDAENPDEEGPIDAEDASEGEDAPAEKP